MIQVKLPVTSLKHGRGKNKIDLPSHVCQQFHSTMVVGVFAVVDALKKYGHIAVLSTIKSDAIFLTPSQASFLMSAVKNVSDDPEIMVTLIAAAESNPDGIDFDVLSTAVSLSDEDEDEIEPSLGDLVQDTLTGFTGICIAKITKLYGETLVEVQPPRSPDLSMIPPAELLEVSRVEILDVSSLESEEDEDEDESIEQVDSEVEVKKAIH